MELRLTRKRGHDMIGTSLKGGCSRMIAAVLLLVIGLAMFLCLQRFLPSTVLVADRQLEVYDAIGIGDSPRKAIGRIGIGEELLVLRCIDLKHYLVPKVVLQDGRIGYVIEGTFHLQRKLLWPSFGY